MFKAKNMTIHSERNKRLRLVEDPIVCMCIQTNVTQVYTSESVLLKMIMY